MERETEENLCKVCNTWFTTLADEKDDTCGSCHRDIVEKEGLCEECGREPWPGVTELTCKTCKAGFEQARLEQHEKG